MPFLLALTCSVYGHLRKDYVAAGGRLMRRNRGETSSLPFAWLLLSSLAGCGDSKPVTIVNHPLVLTPQPVTLQLKPPLRAKGATFDFSFAMPAHSLCSIYDWVFYGSAGERVGITVTFVTADGHRDRFGSQYVNRAPEEVPQPCTRDQTPFGRLDRDTRPVYTYVVLTATDSITIAGLTVKTGNPEALFP